MLISVSSASASASSEASASLAATDTSGFAAIGLGFGLFFVVIFIALYFLPGIIATARKHHNVVPIWLVNIFLGWSMIGWIAALIWAFTAKPAPVIVHINTSHDRNEDR